MLRTNELVILGVFLTSLTDLVLCLLAFSDLARIQRQGYGWIYWIALCAFVPVLGPLAYFLVKEKKNA
jgi:hypothetical protein